jgi:EPS-associated MarR family transcriptional regulator
MPDSDIFNLKREEVLNLLREVTSSPGMTQRELSSKIGISLGKLNFILRACIEKGLVKVSNFKKNNNRSAYLYYLTPEGFEEKARITYHFLKRKTLEYEALEREIQLLKAELQQKDAHPSKLTE